jgi:hypothetical protein
MHTSHSSVDVEKLSQSHVVLSRVETLVRSAECFPVLCFVRIQYASQKANGAQILR